MINEYLTMVSHSYYITNACRRTLEQDLLIQKFGDFIDQLNDAAADTFHDHSRVMYDMVQENFRPAASTVGLRKLFFCYPYMKQRWV